MGTGKRPISTAARLWDKAVALELEMLQAAIGLAEQLEPETSEQGTVSAEELELEISLLATVLALEHKISGPLVGPVAESAREISVAAIALAVAQVPAARVAESVQCRRAARLAPAAEIALEIVVSHPAQDSDPVAALSAAAVGLGATPLDRPVVAEAPAWAVAVLVVAEEAAVAEVAVAAVVVGAGDK